MTRRRGSAALAAALLALVLVVAASPGAEAQDGVGSSSTTSLVELPDAEIIPRPNTGREPAEAGDRGGSLQILVFVVVLVAIGGGVLFVVRESRRARS